MCARPRAAGRRRIFWLRRWCGEAPSHEILITNKNPRQSRGQRHDPSRRPREKSGDLLVLRGCFAAVLHEVVFNHLVFIEGGESGALDGGDVDEDVLVTAVRLDEPISLGRVEPFDGALLRHPQSPPLDTKTTRPLFACHATNGLPVVCSSLESQCRETHSRAANSDCVRYCNMKIAR